MNHLFNISNLSLTGQTVTSIALAFIAFGTDDFSVFLRILLSLIYVAVLGCERASKRHAAGLRIFIIVVLAICICMLLDNARSYAIPVLSASAVIGLALVSVNSTRYSSRSQSKGLTTSVGLWTCGIVRFTVGAGLYTISQLSFAALFFTLWLFPAFEGYLIIRSNYFEVHLELVNSRYLQNFVTTIRDLKQYKTHKAIIEALATLDYIDHIEKM